VTTHQTTQPQEIGAPRIGALDGLRGLAVAGVLAYHAGFGWARGGFLGVSLFFTLSGFLITTLLLGEWASSGRISLRAFWARRARRLLPAAMVALGGIVVFGATVASASQLRDLRGDVLGALGYVANWRFVAAGSSYGDLWSSPSPVQHFWSLAIEEQLYLVIPLVVAASLAAARGRLGVVAAALGTLLLASVGAGLVAGDGLRAYYGTDVRAAELLVGALLAVAVAGRPAIERHPVVPVAAPVALVALVVAWVATSQTDPRLYRGGLLAHAVLAAMVIVGSRSGGPMATALEWAPLRWLGRISYGAYLYHWPIFLWLDETRVGLSGVWLAATRVAVTLAAAAVSARVLEEPVRRGARVRGRLVPVIAGAAAASVAAGVLLVTVSVPAPAIGVELTGASRLVEPSRVAPAPLAVAPIVAPGAAPATAPLADATTIAPPAGPGPGVHIAPVPRAPGERLRVYVAGDSNAFVLGLKMLRWGERNGADVWASGWFACHIVPGGTYRWAGQPKHTEDKCNNWKETRAREIATIQPHVVLVIYGSFDLLDRRWDGSDEWTHIGRPDFDRLLKQNIEEMTDLLAAGGARVIWATYPRTRTGVIDGVPPPRDFPEVDEYRVARLNTFIREVTAARPFAGVIDLRRYMQAWPNGELDPERRPDGIHPSDHEAVNIAEWAAQQLMSRMERERAATP